MYEQHFNLSARPFSAFPEPGMIYWAEGHRMAHTMLSYGMTSTHGVVVISGEIGCGKTTLLEKLCTGNKYNFEIGRLEGQAGRGEDLHAWVLYAFGRPYKFDSQIDSLEALKQFLQAQANKNSKAVLFIDEAQLIDEGTLEGLRLLADKLYNGKPALQLVLLGQPELGRIINQPSLTQLRQRVVSHYHLKPLKPQETYGYIQQRLVICGGDKHLFSDEALMMVHQASKGVPRAINIICDTAMVYAFSEGQDKIDRKTIEAVINDRSNHGLLDTSVDPAFVQ